MSNYIKEVTKTKELRKVYGNTLIDMMTKDERVVALEADLMSAIATKSVQDTFADRLINCGIQEANMMGVAAGLSVTGMIPFVHSFGIFVTRRAYDQLFLSLGYAQLNARIIGSDAGVSATHNGGTHMPFEDLALVNAIPNSIVMEMSDDTMFEQLLKKTKDEYGLYYFRIVRKEMRKLYHEDQTFEVGKGIVLEDGSDVTIVASGIMVDEALKAREILAKEGIDAAVIDMFTIKPIDEALLVEYAKKTKLVVTAENHNVIGGLGTMVSQCIGEQHPVKMRHIGVKESFGQVGTKEYLQEVYKLRAVDIVEAVKDGLK
ncbi:MAG: transketolase family protein [Candidatus Izemoplasmataceae bacterium]